MQKKYTLKLEKNTPKSKFRQTHTGLQKEDQSGGWSSELCTICTNATASMKYDLIFVAQHAYHISEIATDRTIESKQTFNTVVIEDARLAKMELRNA